MFITALSIAGLLLAQDTHVSGPPTGVVLENLRSAQRMIQVSDSAIVLQGSGLLYQSEEVAVTLRLAPGQTYQVLGVCDENCGDADMWAEDRGDVLGGDFKSSSLVMFPLQVPASGVITFKAVVPGCRVTRCAWGYRIYSAGSGW